MREPASQWANCLAVVLSGIAILAPQIHSIFGFVFINFLSWELSSDSYGRNEVGSGDFGSRFLL